MLSVEKVGEEVLEDWRVKDKTCCTRIKYTNYFVKKKVQYGFTDIHVLNWPIDIWLNASILSTQFYEFLFRIHMYY